MSHKQPLSQEIHNHNKGFVVYYSIKKLITSFALENQCQIAILSYLITILMKIQLKLILAGEQ